MADEILFTAEKSAIAAAISMVSGATDKKDSIPILTHILVSRIDDARMMLTASNLSQEISCSFPAEAAAAFEPVALPSQNFTDVVKGAPDADITVTGRRSVGLGALEGAEIRAGKYRARMQVLPGGDFPIIPCATIGSVISLGSARLLSAVDTVAWAAEEDTKVRFALCGVRLDPVDGDLVVVASNRHKLAIHRIPRASLDDDIVDMPAITVPNAAIKLLPKILKDSEDVELDITAERLRITAGSTVLVTKLISEDFIPYYRLVPPADAVSVSFANKQLSASIARVMTASDRKKNGISLDIRQGSIGVYTRGVEGDEAQDEISASATGDLHQGFNGKWLCDALEKLAGDETDFLVSRAQSAPCILTSRADPLTRMMISPLAVTWLFGGSS